jgi:ectoine hydroxylase-related dioxygenase (phytanoyl-CoA dioxygenase family)
MPGLFAGQEVAAMLGAIEALAALPPEACIGRQMVYFEEDVRQEGCKVLSRIEKFVEYSPVLQRVTEDPRLLRPLRQMLGDEPVLFKEKINFKMPGGQGFEPHQDIQPGWDAYADYFVSVLITIDPSTEENGCLELAPGHHTRGLIGEKWKPLHGGQLDGVVFIKCPTRPGDVVLFDCFVPHQSAPNRTDRPRRNLYLTYNRRAAGDHRLRYYADKRASFPPDYEREPGKEYRYRV